MVYLSPDIPSMTSTCCRRPFPVRVNLAVGRGATDFARRKSMFSCCSLTLQSQHQNVGCSVDFKTCLCVCQFPRALLYLCGENFIHLRFLRKAALFFLFDPHNYKLNVYISKLPTLLDKWRISQNPHPCRYPCTHPAPCIILL